MLEIKVLEDGAKKSELLSEHSKEQGEIMAAFDRGEIIAYTVFSLLEKSAVIEYIVPESDFMLADGMLRSTIHVALCRGKSEIYYADTVSEGLLNTLKFIKDKEKKLLDHEKLFGSCCCGK